MYATEWQPNLMVFYIRNFENSTCLKEQLSAEGFSISGGTTLKAELAALPEVCTSQEDRAKIVALVILYEVLCRAIHEVDVILHLPRMEGVGELMHHIFVALGELTETSNHQWELTYGPNKRPIIMYSKLSEEEMV